ncbi:MAG: hypothetical protein R3F02_13485 [Thiolinea sp.]
MLAVSVDNHFPRLTPNKSSKGISWITPAFPAVSYPLEATTMALSTKFAQTSRRKGGLIMKQLKFMISPLLTVLLSVACQAKTNSVLDNFPVVTNRWHSLHFDLIFDENKLAYQRIKMFENSRVDSAKIYEGELYQGKMNLLRPILTSIRSRPFQKAFDTVHQGLRGKQYDNDEFVGIQFELDDNPATQEWYLAFQFEFCSSNNSSGDALTTTCNDEQIHSWIIQSQGEAGYRILMETNGLMRISKNKQSHGYKSIITYSFNRLNYPSPTENRVEGEPPPCGRGEIEWAYTDSQYLPIKLTPIKGSCDLQFLDDNETLEEFAERTEPIIKFYLEKWIKEKINQQ